MNDDLHIALVADNADDPEAIDTIEDLTALIGELRDRGASQAEFFGEAAIALGASVDKTFFATDDDPEFSFDAGSLIRFVRFAQLVWAQEFAGKLVAAGREIGHRDIAEAVKQSQDATRN